VLGAEGGFDGGSAALRAFVDARRWKKPEGRAERHSAFF
jgi:hypothetical protein